jgi:RimJ/RimL family protein N-acetyltransferase
MEYQRQGIGAEMRAAVLQFAFDHLGARRARTSAFTDNVASNRVSRRLGYRADGSETLARRGQPADLVRFVLEPAWFVRPGWTLEVSGVAGCLGLLGAG